MEFVPFTTEQLSYLAKQDPCLAPIFEGVFAADELPGLPEQHGKKSLHRQHRNIKQCNKILHNYTNTLRDRCHRIQDEFNQPQNNLVKD